MCLLSMHTPMCTVYTVQYTVHMPHSILWPHAHTSISYMDESTLEGHSQKKKGVLILLLGPPSSLGPQRVALTNAVHSCVPIDGGGAGDCSDSHSQTSSDMKLQYAQ